MSHLPRQQERNDAALKKGGRGNSNFQKPGLPNAGRGGGTGPSVGAPGRNPLPSSRTNKRTSNGLPGSGRGSGSVDNPPIAVQVGVLPSSQQAGQRGIPAPRQTQTGADNTSSAAADVGNKPTSSTTLVPSAASGGRGSGPPPSGDGGSRSAGIGGKTGPPAATTATPHPSPPVPSPAHVAKQNSEGSEKSAGGGHSSRMAPAMPGANIQFGSLPMQPEPDNMRYTNLRTNSAPPNLFEQIKEQVQYEATSLGNKLPGVAVAPQSQASPAIIRDTVPAFPTQAAAVQSLTHPVTVPSHPQPLPQQVHAPVHAHAQLPVGSQSAGQQAHPQTVMKPTLQQPPPQMPFSGGSHSPQSLGAQPPSMVNANVGPMGHGAPKFQQAHMMQHPGQMMGNQMQHLPPQMAPGMSGPTQTFGPAMGGMAGMTMRMPQPQQMSGGVDFMQPRKSKAIKIVDPLTKKEVKVDGKDTGGMAHPGDGPSTSGVGPAYIGSQIRQSSMAVTAAPQIPQMSYPGHQMMPHSTQFYSPVPPNGQVGLPSPPYYAQQNTVKPGMAMPNMVPQGGGQVRYHQPPYGSAVGFASGGPIHANTMKMGMTVGSTGLSPGAPDMTIHGLPGVGMQQIPVGVPLRPGVPGQPLVPPVAGPGATAVARSIAPLALPPQPLGMPQPGGVGGTHTSDLASPTQLPVGFSSEGIPGTTPTLVPHAATNMVGDMHRRPSDNAYPVANSYNYVRNPNPSPRPTVGIQQQRMGQAAKPNTPPMGQNAPGTGVGSFNQGGGVKMVDVPGRQHGNAGAPDHIQAGGQAGKRHPNNKPQRQQPPPQAQRPGPSSANPQAWPSASPDAAEGGSATTALGTVENTAWAGATASVIAAAHGPSGPATTGGTPMSAEPKPAQPVSGARVASAGPPGTSQGAGAARGGLQDRPGPKPSDPGPASARAGPEKAAGTSAAIPEGGDSKGTAPHASAPVTPAAATVTSGAWGKGPPSSITSAAPRPTPATGVATGPSVAAASAAPTTAQPRPGPASGKEGLGLLGQVRELREQAREVVPAGKAAMAAPNVSRKDSSAGDHGRTAGQKTGGAESATPAQPGGDTSLASAAPASGSAGGAVVRGPGKGSVNRKDAPPSGPPASAGKEKWMEVGRTEAGKVEDAAQLAKRPSPAVGATAGVPAPVAPSGAPGLNEPSVAAAPVSGDAGKVAQGPADTAIPSGGKEAVTGGATPMVAAGGRGQQGPTGSATRGPSGGEHPPAKEVAKQQPGPGPDGRAAGGAWGSGRGGASKEGKGLSPAAVAAKANLAAASVTKEPAALTGVSVNVLESSTGSGPTDGVGGVVAGNKGDAATTVSSKKEAAASVGGAPAKEKLAGDAKPAEAPVVGPVKADVAAVGPVKDKVAGEAKPADVPVAARQLKNVPPKKRGAAAAVAQAAVVDAGVPQAAQAQAQVPTPARTTPLASAGTEAKETEGAKAQTTGAAVDQVPSAVASANAQTAKAQPPQQQVSSSAKVSEVVEEKKTPVESAKPAAAPPAKGKEGKHAGKGGKKGAALAAASPAVDTVPAPRKEEAPVVPALDKGEKVAKVPVVEASEKKPAEPKVVQTPAPVAETTEKPPSGSLPSAASIAKTDPVQAAAKAAVLVAVAAAPVAIAEVAATAGPEEPAGSVVVGSVAPKPGKATDGGDAVKAAAGADAKSEPQKEMAPAAAVDTKLSASKVSPEVSEAAVVVPSGGDAEVSSAAALKSVENGKGAELEGKVGPSAKKGASEGLAADKGALGAAAVAKSLTDEVAGGSGKEGSSGQHQQDVTVGAGDNGKEGASPSGSSEEGPEAKVAGTAVEAEVAAAAPSKGSASKKKKDYKAFDAKSELESKSTDLYSAYKAPAAEPSKGKETGAADAVKKEEVAATASAVEEATTKDADVDDWEDAADMPTPRMGKKTVSDSSGGAGDGAGSGGASGVRKYTRDFLQTLRGAGQGLPEDFQEQIREKGLQINFLEVVLGPEGLRNMAMGGPRTSSGGGPMGEDDRWQRGIAGGVLGPPGFRGGPPMGGRGPMMGGPGGRGGGMMGGPGGHMQYGMGPGHPPGPGGPGGKMAGSNGVEADRWGKNPQFRGPAAAPRMNMPVPAIHRLDEEQRFVIGRVTDEEQAKQKKVKGILNKLTPQRFDVLFEQALEVGIDNPDTLAGVISQIFEKALFEPSFCEMYARFCHRLSTELPEFVVNGEKITFKRVLLNKCQDEFMKGKAEEKSAEEEGTEEDEANPRAKALKEEKLMKARQRTLGNIRLIGEVYKLNMLTERIMHSCILELLGEDSRTTPHEEQVEALCKLMTTIGAIIDHDKAKAHMDAYFSKMESLSSNDKLLSKRHRFMLIDVIELRRNDWHVRRKVDGPKMINEVHRDAEQEHRNRLASANAVLQRGGGSGRDRRGPPDRAPPPMRGPGPMAGGPPQRRGGPQDARGEDSMADADRFAGPARTLQAQRPTDEGDLRLGPQGGLGRGMGARGSGPGPSGRDGMGMGMGVQDARRGGMPDRGMYGAGGSGRGHESPARGRYEEQPSCGRGGPPHSGDSNRGGGGGGGYGDHAFGPPERGGGGRMERGGSGSFGVDRDRSGGGMGGSDSRPSSRDGRGGGERPGMLGQGPAAAAAASLSAGGAGGREIRPATPPQSGGGGGAPSATKEECVEKSRTSLLEYSRDNNVTEVKLCLEEFHTQKFNADIVASWLDLASQATQKQAEVRTALPRLITQLYKASPPLLTAEHLAEGLRMYLDTMEDAVVDAPLAPELVGTMLGRMVADGTFVLAAVVKSIAEAGPEPEAAGALIDAGYGLKMLSSILAAVREEKGSDEMIALFRASGVDPKDLVAEHARNKEQELERFKEAHGILSPMIPLRRTLTEMLSRGENVEKAWVEENVSAGIRADPAFARMVMDVVLGTVTGPKEVTAVEGHIKKYAELLKFVAKEKREKVANTLQYLFALQNFAHEMDHPPGLLNTLFQRLFEQDVVEEVGFLRWKDDNKDSTPGKLKAIMSTQEFYEWLQSLDVEEEEAS